MSEKFILPFFFKNFSKNSDLFWFFTKKVPIFEQVDEQLRDLGTSLKKI